MDIKDVLKDLKKVDLELIKKSDIKIFRNEKIAVEYYNDAVDNILEGNTDIAAIKLKKVLGLSPDFSEAAQLLERLNEYERFHSIGDKVYESMHGRDVNALGSISGRKNLPQKLNINPRILLKIIIVIVVIAVTVGICIAIFKLFDKQLESENNTKEVSYSQEEVNALNERIDELEESLIKSESETQKILSDSSSDKTSISELEQEQVNLQSLLALYKAAVYFDRDKYILSADIVNELDETMYKSEDRELFNEVYIKAVTKAADDLYETGLRLFSQNDFQGTVDHLGQVDKYSPEYEELGNCYYVLAKAYYELDNTAESLRLYKYIEMNIESFQNETGLLYYTGKAYQKLEQYSKAKEMYNLLISDFPNSTLVGDAKDRLKEIPNS